MYVYSWNENSVYGKAVANFHIALKEKYVLLIYEYFYTVYSYIEKVFEL